MKKDTYFKEKFEQIFDVIKHIHIYLTNGWEVLFHPKRSFPKILKDSKSLLLFKSTSFFVINIIVACIVGTFLHYRVAKFPLEITSRFDIFRLNNIFLIVGPYILGVLGFATLLRLIAKWYRINISQSKVFSIVCYASAIFIPFILAKIFCNNLLDGIFLKMFNNLQASTSNQSTIIFGMIMSCTIILWLTVMVIFITWWLYLVYLGLKSLGILETKRLKKIVIFTFLTFFLIEFLINCIVIHRPNIEAIKIFIAKDIHKAVSTKPPNYPKASLLAEKMSDCELFSPYLRYVAKIEKVAYSLAFYLPLLDDNGKQIVNQVLENISKQNYDEAQQILTSYLKESLYDETNANLHSKVEFERGSVTYGMEISSKKSFYEAEKYFYKFFIDDIEEAKQLRNLPDYVDKNKSIYFSHNPFSNSKFTYSPVALFP